MGLRTPLLIVAAWLLALPVADARAARELCLRCHQPHYAAVAGCTVCHRGDARSDRPAIAHRDLIRGKFSWFALPGAAPLLRGEKLLERYACRRCHGVGGKGNRLAANLDRLNAETSPQQLYDSIRSPALFMPDFRFADREATDLVNAIWAAAARGGRAGVEAPQVVHFDNPSSAEQNVFDKHCGGCHRALTAAGGPLGKGDIGPNLSGLLSAFYPTTAGRQPGVDGASVPLARAQAPSQAGGRSVAAPGSGPLLPVRAGSRWQSSELQKWLENPRKLREHTQMRPVPLTRTEWEKLLALLSDSAASR